MSKNNVTKNWQPPFISEYSEAHVSILLHKLRDRTMYHDAMEFIFESLMLHILKNISLRLFVKP